jgi:phospholipid/cholesterol/gamma-HCH transport system substrate-binding protein
MRITRRVLINSAAFGILSIALVALLAFRVLPTVFGSTYSIYGIFTAAGGVATNQEVTYRGVQVGRVGKMTLTPDKVKIEMIIESGFTIPKDGTRARVLFKSAVGEQFIDLLPQSERGPDFRPGDVIPADMTSIPIQTEDLLRELDSVLRSIDPKALGSLIHELGTGLGGHGQDLRDLILALDQLTTIGVQRRAEIGGLLANSAALQDSFNSTRTDFVRANASLRTVVETLAARRDELARTLATTRALDGDILNLLDTRRKELEQVVADLGTVVRIAHDHRDDLDKLLTFLGPFLGDAVKAFDSPYYVFNLVTNTESPQCSYTPSSRPVRPVTDTTPKQPATTFACSANSATTSPASSSIAAMPAALRLRFDQVSWLGVYWPGS